MMLSQQKVAVVTGSNKGIGFATVKGLCQNFSGDVFLTSRDESRGLAAVKSLNQLGFYPKFHQLDITNDESIVELKNYLVQEYGGLDILVNNAGIGFQVGSTEPLPQAKETIRINYFATRKVCDILFPILRSHARIVNVSSQYGKLCRIPSESLRKKLSSETLTIDQLDELMNDFVKSFEHDDDVALHWGNSAYSVSKVGVAALTRIQQRNFLEDHERVDIVVNAVHPGYVDTDLTYHKGSLTPDEGAVSSLYAALLPKNITEPKGGFIMQDKTIVDWTAPC